MTFTEIVTDVAGRVNLTTTEALTRIGTHVNRRYRRVTTSIGLVDFRRVSNAFVVTTGNRLQTITGIEKVISILNANVANSTPLDEIAYDEMLEVIPSTGAPTRFAVKRLSDSSVTLIFDTTFASATTLTVEGEEMASTLSGSQVPAFSESFHDILIFGALADELRKKEKIALARDADSEYERMLGELRLHIAVSGFRDVVQGKRNTTSTAADFASSGGSGSGAALDGSFQSLHVFGNAVVDGSATVAGSVFISSAASSAGGYFERSRVKALGEWTPRAFSAANFTANGTMTWVLAAGDVLDEAYMQVGKTLFYKFVFNTTTVGGVASSELRVSLPAGLTAASLSIVPYILIDNGTLRTGLVQAVAGATFLRFQLAGGGNFALAADTTSIFGQIAVETTT